VGQGQGPQNACQKIRRPKRGRGGKHSEAKSRTELALVRGEKGLGENAPKESPKATLRGKNSRPARAIFRTSLLAPHTGRI